jgi:hypothetical protein
VSYQLTALTRDAAAKLSAFSTTYSHHIRGWRHAILDSTTTQVLSRRAPPAVQLSLMFIQLHQIGSCCS